MIYRILVVGRLPPLCVLLVTTFGLHSVDIMCGNFSLLAVILSLNGFKRFCLCLAVQLLCPSNLLLYRRLSPNLSLVLPNY